MSGNVTLVQIVNTTQEPNTTSLVVIAISFVIGIALLTYGLQKRRKMVWYLGIGATIGAIVAFFTESQSFRDIMVAAAVVMASVVSIASLYINDKNRKETFETEAKEIERNKLVEIKHWLDEIQLQIIHQYVGDVSEAKERRREQLIESLSKCSLDAVYISSLITDITSHKKNDENLSKFSETIKDVYSAISELWSLEIKLVEAPEDQTLGKQETECALKLNKKSQDAQLSLFKVLIGMGSSYETKNID